MGPFTYRIVTPTGSEILSSFASQDEAALQAVADLASGRAASIAIFDASGEPAPAQYEPPVVVGDPVATDDTLPTEDALRASIETLGE